MSSNHETLLRQWQMLRLIPRYPSKITASVLKTKLDAEGLGVTKRTVERDLNELSLTFPLTQDSRSKPYGWSWQKDAPSFDLPGLTHHEALLLVMVEQNLKSILPTTTLTAMGPYFKMAEMRLSEHAKLSKAKPWPGKVRSVPTSQPLFPPTIDSHVQQAVFDALLEDKQLQIKYRKKGESEFVDYRIHPLALVQRGPVFYLCVRIYDYQDVRLLVLHRIVEANILEQSVVVPDGFNLDDAVAHGLMGFGAGDEVSLTLRFPKAYGEHLYETPLSLDQTIEEKSDDHLIVRAVVPKTQQLIWWLRAFGDNVEVLHPEGLLNGD
jgi:predicted DNA-binding transcriptional regulator YafY